MHPLIKIIIDLGPLVGFFIAFKLYDIIEATKAIMLLSVIAAGISYYYEKNISKVQLSTLIILLFLGSITLFTQDSTYIKIKPTIIYSMLAVILLISLVFKKIILRDLFNKMLSLTDKGWIILSKRCIAFFLFLAVFNELLWRNLSEDLWVIFKAFGIPLFIILFVVGHLSFFKEHKND
jgi:intracellular septation protein